MAQSKEFFTRIQHKHDIEANWSKAVNFVPLNGEIIVYDKDDTHDYARIKIGDGVTKINELHFMLNDSVLYTEQILVDEQKRQARTNINAYGFDWHSLGQYRGYVANIEGKDSITDWETLLSVPSSTTTGVCAFAVLAQAIDNLLDGDDKNKLKYNIVQHFNSAMSDLISAGFSLSNYRFVFTKDIGNTNKYRFIWLWYIESQDRWFISDENESLIRAVHVTSGVITFDDTLTYPDTTLSIADRTADAKAVGDALATKVSFTKVQELTDEQKEIARTNIGVITDTYATKTELTEATTDLVYFSEENQEAATVPLNADTWSGYTPTAFLNLVYPIGSIYMSVNNVNPATLFGGTWEQIKDRFLLSAGSTYSAGSTGGAATVTLTAAQMPKHRHTTALWNNAGTKANAKKTSGYGANVTDATSGLTGTWGSWQTSTFQVAGSGYGDPNGITDVAGNGVAHNNMPPYLAVYVWKRTA